MKKLITLMLLFGLLGLQMNIVFADSVEQFTFLSSLKGQWKLAAANLQEGKATKHKLVAPLLGTDKVAMNFKLIGKGTTLQENLLPGNKKEMATMYHCNDSKDCQKLLAKHYCAKKNQPEFIAEDISKNNMLVLNCNMNTALCNSKNDHVHKITHELLDKNHLKTTYTSYKGGKKKGDSIYHFARVN